MKKYIDNLADFVDEVNKGKKVVFSQLSGRLKNNIDLYFLPEIYGIKGDEVKERKLFLRAPSAFRELRNNQKNARGLFWDIEFVTIKDILARAR